jgi:hypothetical protein
MIGLAVEIADDIVFVGLPVELHPRRCGTEIIEIRRAAGLGDLIWEAVSCGQGEAAAATVVVASSGSSRRVSNLIFAGWLPQDRTSSRSGPLV